MRRLLAVLSLSIFAVLSPLQASAVIDGLTGTTFNLRAKVGYISTPDGGSLYSWGFASAGGEMQYPGPTLIVNQGDLVTVKLKNELPVAVSIVFPGQQGVTASGGGTGLLTQEAPGDGTTEVTYTFTASRPGTFLYHSGTRPDLQVEMGLFGALIVRPSVPNRAYDHVSSAYDHEYLFLLSEMDPSIHELVKEGRMSEVDTTKWFPTLWFINGRNAPDTLAEPGTEVLTHQPYNCMPRMHPGERLLMRILNAGRDLHPFHTHGNHHTVIAQDGRLLESSPGSGADLAYADFTLKTASGQTYDAIFEWTGKDLGWDIYGHQPGDPLQPNEYAPDHGKPFPVILPEQQSLTFGKHFSGSPFLGTFADLPPGEGGMNPNAGYFLMWHSHTEKEMVNFDIFPGGMMTMVIIEPPGVPIP